MTVTQSDSRGHARAARLAKRAHAEGLGVNERFISRMVDRFYASIRQDGILGPIFAERVTDWPQHLDRMKSFWRAVLFNSGEFSGNPMLKHMAIPDLEVEHFERWLNLFYSTLREMEVEPEGTTLVATKARSIADSLLTGIATRRRGIAGAKAGKDLPYV